MVRTFATHKIRKTQEISSCLWDFCTLPEQGKEEAVKGKAAVPGGWESCPDTRTYRGRACYEPVSYTHLNEQIFRSATHADFYSVFNIM